MIVIQSESEVCVCVFVCLYAGCFFNCPPVHEGGGVAVKKNHPVSLFLLNIFLCLSGYLCLGLRLCVNEFKLFGVS